MRVMVGSLVVCLLVVAWRTEALAQTPKESPPADTAAQPSLPLADGETNEPVRLKETVVVTATRGAIDTDKSPASAAVVTRADIERQNPLTVDQALTTVEGVSAYRARGVPDNGVGIGMRGFSGRSSGQSRVLVLLDGQPINDPYIGSVNWNAVPVEEVDRIEVVRGPFSSLYGGNAMGGVVNVLTRPVDRRSFELTSQYGTHATGSFNGRYADRFFGRLGVTFAYDHLRTGGYPAQLVTRTATTSTAAGGLPVSGLTRYATAANGVNYVAGTRGNNWFHQNDLRARAEYVFGPQTFGIFQYVRQSNETGWGAYQSSVRAADGRTVDSGDVIFQEGDVWRKVTLLPSQFLGAGQGGSSNTYQAQVLHSTAHHGQLRAQGGVFDTPLAWTSLAATAATLSGGPGTRTFQTTRGIYANVQWSASAGPRNGITAGADTRHDGATIIERPTLNYLSGAALDTRNTFSNGKALVEGVYAQDQIAISPRLQVTAGGRYDYWRSYDGQTQPNAASATHAYADRTQGALTGKLAAVFSIGAGTTLRSSVGTAFRHPTVYELYRDLLDVGSYLVGNPTLKPERLFAWEAGVRQRVGHTGSLDAVYYQNRVTDLIYRGTDFASDPTGATRRMFNAGEGKTRGFEFGATEHPAGWLTAREAYTFTDAIITKNASVPLSVGKQIPFVPRHTASASLTASHARASLTGTGRYQSDVFSTDTNTDVVNHVPGTYDRFFLMDVAGSVNMTKRVTVLVTADDLFNRRYYMFYLNPGRVVMAGIRLRF